MLSEALRRLFGPPYDGLGKDQALQAADEIDRLIDELTSATDELETLIAKRDMTTNPDTAAQAEVVRLRAVMTAVADRMRGEPLTFQKGCVSMLDQALSAPLPGNPATTGGDAVERWAARLIEELDDNGLLQAYPSDQDQLDRADIVERHIRALAEPD